MSDEQKQQGMEIPDEYNVEDSKTQPKVQTAAQPVAHMQSDGGMDIPQEYSGEVPAGKPAVSTAETKKNPVYNDPTKESHPVGEFLSEHPTVASGLEWFNKHVAQPPVRMGEEAGHIGGHMAKTAAMDIDQTLSNPGQVMNDLDPTAPQPVHKDPVQREQELAQYEKENPVIAGIAQGIGEFTGGFVGNPTNWPFMASNTAPAFLKKAMAYGFGTQMAKGEYDNIKNLTTNWKDMTVEQRAAALTQLVPQTYFTAHAAAETGAPQAIHENVVAPAIRGAAGVASKVAPVLPYAAGALAGHLADHPYIGGLMGKLVIPKDSVNKALEMGRMYGLSDEDAAAKWTAERATEATNNAQRVKADLDKFKASSAQGNAPAAYVDAYAKAQQAADEATYHAEEAKTAAVAAKKQTKGTVPEPVPFHGPTPAEAEPEITAKPAVPAEPTLGKLGAPKAPPTASPAHATTTIPQAPTEAPKVGYRTMQLPGGEPVGKQLQLTEGTPEGPQAPKGGFPKINIPEEKTVAPKATKPERGNLRDLKVDEKGNVVEKDPEGERLHQLLIESLKNTKGNENFPAATVEKPAAKVEEVPAEKRAGDRRQAEVPVEEEKRTGERRNAAGLRVDAEGNPTLSPDVEGHWQAGAFGEKPVEDIGAKAREANPEPTRAETKPVLPKEEPTGYAAKKEEVVPAGSEGREPVKSAAEYHPAVQQKVGELSDTNLKQLAKAHGLNPDEYDFNARDERRHRTERDQLAKDITAEMGEDEKINLGRAADATEKQGLFQGADTSAKGRAARAEKMFPRLRGPVDENGNPKASGGAPDEADLPYKPTKEREAESKAKEAYFKSTRLGNHTQNVPFAQYGEPSEFTPPKRPSPGYEKVGTKEAADKDNEHFANAKKELGPKASISEVAKRAQEMKDTHTQLAEHDKNGGSTFSSKGKDLNGTDKYSVGAYPDRTEQVDKLTPERLEEFKKKNSDVLSKEDHAVGTWKDPDTGKAVLDVTKQYSDREEAVAAGKAANQKSIYHLGGEGEIQTGGAGDYKNTTKASVDEYAKAFRENPEAAGLIKNHGKDMSVDEIKKEMEGRDIIQWVKDGKPQEAFVSVDKDGNISRVINNAKDAVGSLDLIRAAIQRGGKTIDAWDIDGKLPKIYEGLGFEKTKTVPYDVENYGEPSQAYKDHWKRFGWKEGDPYPSITDMKLKAQVNAKGSPVDEFGNPTISGGAQISGENKRTMFFDPEKLTPKPHELENAKLRMQESGKTPIEWAKEMKAKNSEPIKVTHHQGVYTIEDGHHRYLAATLLNDALKAEVTDKPVAKNAKGSPVDEFGNPTVSGGAPEKKLPTGDELIKKYGESSGDPKDTTFILKDGRGVRNTGNIHDEMLGGKATDKNPPRERFVAEGNIRVRPHQGAGGREVAFSIPESGVTADQLKYIQKMSPQLRSGAVMIEVGKPGGSYKAIPHGEASPEAIETAIRGIGPVLNDKGSPIDWNGNPTVSGGSPAAGVGTAKAKALPKLAEEHLTEEEKAGVTKTEAGRKSFVDNLKKLPSVQEFTDIAKAGEGGRKWYQRSSAAFDALTEEAPKYFKDGDRQKFTDFLAALSPQQSVKMNLGEALNAWTRYVDEGRPTGEPLKKMLRDELTLSGAKIPNATKALAGEPLWPDLSKNSNFKVPSFAKNLSGYLNHVTNDGWQALFGGLDAKDIATAKSYHPLAVVTREAAKALGWEPAEAQAAIWAFTKTFTEKGETEPADIRRRSEDFADILAMDPEIRQQLKQLGVNHDQLDAKLRAIGRKPPITSGASPTTENSVRKLATRIEGARGKGTIPPPKSGNLNFNDEDEETRFNPSEFTNEEFGLGKLGEKKKKSPYGKL